jgi:FG-GAP repeat
MLPNRVWTAAATVLFSSLGWTQGALFLWDGPGTDSLFGSSVAGAGDVDGDGLEDIIVGSPLESTNGTYSGGARVYSGADGQLLYTILGEGPGDGLGVAVGGGQDVNGDGFDDFIVGVPGDFVLNRGSVRVHSGKDGSLLRKLTGAAANDQFGWSVSLLGDVDGDGLAEIAVGAPPAAPNGPGSGIVYLFSGATGLVLFEFQGDAAGVNLGKSIANAGDVDGDGGDDLIVGVPGGWMDGRAFVFSGSDGSTLLALGDSHPGGDFGSAVSGAGDVDGDGLTDVIVGDWTDGTGGQESGSAQVFSGATGALLHSLHGNEDYADLGYSVAGYGDWNQDSLADFLVGVPNGGAYGELRVYSGADGTLLHTFESGESGDGLGHSCDVLRDLDGDGRPEVLAGASRWDSPQGDDTGRAMVFTVRNEVGQPYCGPATFNSSGQSATLAALGSRVAVLNDLRLEATGTALNQFGIFLNSQTPGLVVPPGSQGNLCLGGGIGRYSSDILQTGPQGQMSLQLDLANTPTPGGPVPIAPGETWYFQGWFRDQNPGPTSNFTDGVTITFF